MNEIKRDTNKTTLTLSGKSQVVFRWIGPERLAVELWKFGTDRYGYGLLFQENVILTGDSLTALFAYLSQQQEQEAA